VKRTVVRHPGAIRDLVDIFVHIGRSRLQTADRFLQAADRTISLLATRPDIGFGYETDNPNLAEIRVCRVSQFSCLSTYFYRATDDHVEILRVFHSERDVDQILTDAFDLDEPS